VASYKLRGWEDESWEKRWYDKNSKILKSKEELIWKQRPERGGVGGGPGPIAGGDTLTSWGRCVREIMWSFNWAPLPCDDVIPSRFASLLLFPLSHFPSCIFIYSINIISPLRNHYYSRGKWVLLRTWASPHYMCGSLHYELLIFCPCIITMIFFLKYKKYILMRNKKIKIKII
jgi:hypothetical protein